MPAETLKCPMCGASAATDSPRCEHCGARLATVACPSCFGMMFVGQKFCSHCGARADRAEIQADRILLCPRCRKGMNAAAIGDTQLQECPRCEGIWVDATSLEKICADRERQAAVLGMAAPIPDGQAGGVEKNIRYVPCPVCMKLMNRVNFARCSNVVVDVCGKHGTWFDRDELRRIVEFIRAGGLEAARAKEMAELEEERRRTKAEQLANAWDTRTTSPESYGDRFDALSAVGSLLKLLRGE